MSWASTQPLFVQRIFTDFLLSEMEGKELIDFEAMADMLGKFSETHCVACGLKFDEAGLCECTRDQAKATV